MSFAFMSIEKIKTLGEMHSKGVHNRREIDSIENVDYSLSDLNEELIPLPKVSGKTLSYDEAFRDRMESLEYYKDHKIRSNAVLGYEVILTYSADENVDPDEWARKSAQWLKETFNKAGDNRDNVLHAVVHKDETGNIHMHALVVPIDPNGHLNASYFTDGSRAMTELQDSYAKSLEGTGIVRGIAGSSARHKDIRRMYASLNNALKFPAPEQGETAEAYMNRITEDIKNAYAAGKRETDEYFTEKQREFDEMRSSQMEELDNVYSQAQHRISIDRKDAEMIVREKEDESVLRIRQYSSQAEDARKKRDAAIDEYSSYRDMADTLAQQLYTMRMQLENQSETAEALEFLQKMRKGMERISDGDEDLANALLDDLDYILERSEDEEITKETETRKTDELAL